MYFVSGSILLGDTIVKINNESPTSSIQLDMLTDGAIVIDGGKIGDSELYLKPAEESNFVKIHFFKDGNKIDLDKETIANIETIFRRADLVKFAKSKPDIELAKLDRNTIDLEIDHVR